MLRVKVEIDWRDEDSKALYGRLRDLGWMAAHYRNSQSIAKLAQQRGWRVDPASADKNDISKQIRQAEKGELSGDVYSCVEQEVRGAWSRDAKKILAGQPVPIWKPNAALSVTGKEKHQDSGIRLERNGSRYILHLRAQSQHSPEGAWLDLPIAKHTKRDEWQGPILDRMVTWEIPIKKVTIRVKPHGIVAALSYAENRPALPPPGRRVATLGPVESDGRLHLRTETQKKDYTSKLVDLRGRKDDWDLIRRRVLSQIGWRKGHARIKREVLARLTWDDWLSDHLHRWTREIVDWCVSQGVGTIQVVQIETDDWPAYRFVQMLRYKAEDAGIEVIDGASLESDSAHRAAKSAVSKRTKKAKRRRDAVRELTHQLGE